MPPTPAEWSRSPPRRASASPCTSMFRGGDRPPCPDGAAARRRRRGHPSGAGAASWMSTPSCAREVSAALSGRQLRGAVPPSPGRGDTYADDRLTLADGAVPEGRHGLSGPEAAGHRPESGRGPCGPEHPQRHRRVRRSVRQRQKGVPRHHRLQERLRRLHRQRAGDGAAAGR